jgi:FkbM family methyltransferase
VSRAVADVLPRIRGRLSRRSREWRRRQRRDDAHLAALLRETLGGDDRVVDVGAHRGDFLTLAYQHAPRGAHVAVEALPDFAARLRARFPQAVVVECAVGAAPGHARFFRPVSMPAWSGLRQQEYPGETEVDVIEVAVRTLDDVVPAGDPVKLLKIDVEGGERDVLLGARGLLARDRPVVYFEYAHVHADPHGVAPADLHDTLAAAGYELFSLSGDGPHDAARFAELARASHRSDYDRRAETNWVARPAG